MDTVQTPDAEVCEFFQVALLPVLMRRTASVL